MSFRLKGLSIRFTLLIIPALLLAVGLLWGLDLVLRLFFLCVLALMLSYLWTSVSIRGLKIEMQPIPAQSQVGKEFAEEITVTNTNRVPKLLLTVAEKTDLPGHNNLATLNLGPGKSDSWTNNVLFKRRGFYTMGLFTATASDPLGLFSQQRILGKPQSVLIYPATVELPFFTLSGSVNFGYGLGLHAIGQVGPDASNVRELYPGDSFSHVHWRSTAHTGKFMVKVFDADRARSGVKHVWVLLDMHQASNAGEGDENTEEYGVTVAASIVKKYLNEGMSVGFAATGDRHYLFPPDKGEVHLRHILEALAQAKATGQVPVEHLVSEVVEQFRGDATAIVITASDAERMGPAFWRLKKHGNSTIAILLDSSSFSGNGSHEHVSRISHSLSSMGVPVYVVKKGEHIGRALDSRAALEYAELV